ncbi:MAG TPA: glycoside hydrolase family 30 beta sandwich domain-containing protein [Verrucomicrobiae bacterium]|jgi:glucosylceramidase|nr:glycoside hydrolase family 30 beta sandwich domain-containing protein [Verrucomicrobiae bacterium]
MRIIPSALLVAAMLALPTAARAQSKTVTVYVTAQKTGQRLERGQPLSWIDLPQPSEQQQCVFVDPSKTFQTVLGIGGALTDAAAETYYKLPEDKRREILRAYFDPQNGIGYTLARTHINSCDFSSSSYTYVAEGDKDLSTFNIAHDLKYRIPFIKEALAASGNIMKIFISPWSPPAWMKSNNNMLFGGKLLPEYADSWANYYAKFIQAYEKEGIPIWGLTVQNEPMAVQTWESCNYTGPEERDFVKNHLGPALSRAGLQDKKIIVWDHNRSMMYQRAQAVLDDPAAAKYVWGVGFHWYVGDHFENVSRVHEAYPNINLLFTEGCNGPYNASELDDWQWGENYGKSMIHDFNNGAVGWTDWNVLLDEHGGPNHVHNYCFAPIHGDTKTGALHYMNSYYYIGHFSKFIRPGARRIISSSTRDELLTTAFVNPDGKIAVVVMNSSNRDEPFYLWLAGEAAHTAAPAHSILTFVVE